MIHLLPVMIDISAHAHRQPFRLGSAHKAASVPDRHQKDNNDLKKQPSQEETATKKNSLWR